MEDRLRKTDEEDPEHGRGAVVRGWIIVAGIALAFVIYGLFAFFVIGDNQPADWDFGAVKDTPGESVYSTYPYRDRTEEPEPQHVNQKPPDASVGSSENVLPEPVERKPKPAESPAGPGQHSTQQVQQPGQAGTK